MYCTHRSWSNHFTFVAAFGIALALTCCFFLFVECSAAGSSRQTSRRKEGNSNIVASCQVVVSTYGVDCHVLLSSVLDQGWIVWHRSRQ